MRRHIEPGPRIIRPPGPVPSSPESETPSETAVLRATGVARARVVARACAGAAEEATAIADADRLEVALDALIENAVNHTQEHDTIEVAIHRRGTRASIECAEHAALLGNSAVRSA